MRNILLIIKIVECKETTQNIDDIFISLKCFKIFSSEVCIFSLQTKNVMSPAKWENEEWCIHYRLQPPLMVDPEGNSGLRQNRLQPISLCSHLTPMVHSEGIQDREKQDS